MVAHGASRGKSAPVTNQPGGRHIEGSRRFTEVSPSGLTASSPLNPRLAPWATICRPPG